MSILNVGNNIGIYAFLFLLPFIILYLIKPKTLTKTIPSLMFFVKHEKRIRQSSFFRKLLNNILFLLQLLVILLLAFSVMNPYMETRDKSTLKNNFIIIDASASMQTKIDGQTRFDKAVDIARQHMSGNVNVMLAYNNEVKVPVRDGWPSEARRELSAAKPSDSIANIEGAMQKADQLLDKKNAKIIVISDFINVLGSYDDPLKSKRILAAKGNEVEFIDLISEADNAGIIEMIPRWDKTQIYVKNFNKEKKAVKVSVIKDNKDVFSESRNVLANSIEIFTFDTPKGEAQIILSPEDDFALDNKVYLSNPEEDKVKVLLITSRTDSFLISALKASRLVDLKIEEPPFTIEQIKDIDPGLIIVHEINKNEIVVGDFQELAKYAEEGKNIIITAQEDMDEIDYNGLIPLDIKGLGGISPVNKIIENQFTKDVEFGTVEKYVRGTPLNKTTILLSSSDNSPLLSFMDRGEYQVVYYGIIDEESDFKSTPSYPIFWNNLIKFLFKSEDIKDYNKKTGESAEFEHTGIFDQNGKRIAANLLHEKESDVGNMHEDFTEQSRLFVIEEREKITKTPLEIYLIVAALVLLMLEIYVLKKRGDL